MFEIGHERTSGLLIARNSGFWSAEVARGYLEAIATETQRVRLTGKLRLLIDGRDAHVLPPEAIAALAPFERIVIRGADDRVAMVVGSSLAKMQTRRNLSHPQIEFFLSESAARTWLRALD